MLAQIFNIFIYNFFVISICNAQSLLINPSFEDHAISGCDVALSENQFAAHMKGWKNIGVGNIYTIDKSNNSCYHSFHNISPKDGNSCVMLEFNPNLGYSPESQQGQGSYLKQTFSRKMSIDSSYLLSFWIYIPSQGKLDTFAKDIGVNFYNKSIGFTKERLIGQELKLPATPFDSWYKIEWNIKPLCELNSMVLGIFDDKLEKEIVEYDGRSSFNYFIDNIEISSKPFLMDSSLRYVCTLEEKTTFSSPVDFEDGVIYFENNSVDILPNYKSYLDSMAIFMKKNPKTTFVLGGHADNIGSENDQLSKRRVESVLFYLLENHKIPSFRLVKLFYGCSNPYATNNTLEGRASNRRVTIHQNNTDIEIQTVIYRNMLESYFENDLDKSIRLLNIWLKECRQKEKMNVLFDPRISELRQRKNDWFLVEKNIRDSYKKFNQPELVFALDSLFAEDQKSRTLKYYIQNKAYYQQYYDEKEQRWDVNFDISAQQEQFKDSCNTIALKHLLNKYSFPNLSEVGERAMKTIFLIATHCSDTAFQKKIINEYYGKCLIGEANWLFYATLYDRYLINQNLPQLYGTQFKLDENGKNTPFPIADEANLSERRSKINLK